MKRIETVPTFRSGSSGISVAGVGYRASSSRGQDEAGTEEVRTTGTRADSIAPQSVPHSHISTMQAPIDKHAVTQHPTSKKTTRAHQTRNIGITTSQGRPIHYPLPPFTTLHFAPARPTSSCSPPRSEGARLAGRETSVRTNVAAERCPVGARGDNNSEGEKDGGPCRKVDAHVDCPNFLNEEKRDRSAAPSDKLCDAGETSSTCNFFW